MHTVRVMSGLVVVEVGHGVWVRGRGTTESVDAEAHAGTAHLGRVSGTGYVPVRRVCRLGRGEIAAVALGIGGSDRLGIAGVAAVALPAVFDAKVLVGSAVLGAHLHRHVVIALEVGGEGALRHVGEAAKPSDGRAGGDGPALLGRPLTTTADNRSGQTSEGPALGQEAKDSMATMRGRDSQEVSSGSRL